MNIQSIGPQARQVLTLGREKYWGFRVAEGNGVLEEETYKDGWWYLPTDSTQITKASKRIQTIKNSGVRIRQVIIAHEASKLLSAPQSPVKLQKGKIVLLAAGAAVATLGVVIAALVVAVALMYLLVPLVTGVAIVMMVGLGVLVDPVAIVVLECGTRIEVMRWTELSSGH